jgi:CubicO group peptidase (beta-lactamase class C family)
MRNKQIATILFAVFISISAIAQTKKKQVENFLKDAMDKEHIPGIAYAVIEKGKVINMGTLGKANLTWNQNVTSETAFQIASVSKVFCGVLLAKLFDEEILQPDQKLSTLIDSIPDSWKNITVMQLAAHQSGIKMASFGNARNSKEALALAKKQTMDFSPGENSAYMSSDYWILQYIIEKKTNMKYYDALQFYVLNPLKMTNTYVNYTSEGMARTSDVIPQEATVYHYDANKKKYRIGDFPFTASGYTAGGIITSISDFSKLAAAISSKTFFKSSSLNLLVNKAPLKVGFGNYGLGFIVRDYESYKIVEHSGGPALADITRFDDKDITVIVLTNQRGVYPYLAKSIASFYIEGLKKQEVPKDYKF